MPIYNIIYTYNVIDGAGVANPLVLSGSNDKSVVVAWLYYTAPVAMTVAGCVVDPSFK